MVGDGISKEEQKRAAKGTRFLPFSQFPPTQLRKDCFYHTTPAMIIPDTAENIDSCEVYMFISKIILLINSRSDLRFKGQS